MRLLAVCMARDEADIIEQTVAHLAAQGARVIVADNLSVDGTGLLAAGAGAEVVVDSDPAYRQSEKITALAARYAREGDWVVPFDADELWDGLAGLDTAHDVAPAWPVVQIPTADGWRDGPTEKFPKVAFRWRPGCVIEQGNHAVTGCGPRVLDGALTVKHYQWRTLEQAKRKARQGAKALELTDLPFDSGLHWRDLARMTDDQIEQWWNEYTA